MRLLTRLYSIPCFPATVWWVIFRGANFRGKSEKALRINFRGFKFRDSNPIQGHVATQTMM